MSENSSRAPLGGPPSDRNGPVTIVVVTYNSEGVLPGFFASLGPALEGVDRATVVVSDNASGDRSIEVATTSWPGVLIVESPTNRGYAAAINAGVMAAGGMGAVLVLNDDIRLGRGAIAALMSELADPKVGVVVPRLVDGDGRLLTSQRRAPSVLRALAEALVGGSRGSRLANTSEIVSDVDLYDVPRDVMWASGCAWLISEQCWDSVGGWDESLFLYGEDLDYALRVHDAGLRMRFTPTASAVHLVGPSHSDARLWSMLVWNRYRVYRRRHGAARGMAFRFALILNEALRALTGNAVHRAGLMALVSPSHRPLEVMGP